MMQKLLRVYECKIINERSKQNIGKFGWTYIILNIICLIIFLVCELLHSNIGALISIVVMIMISIIFTKIVNKIVKISEQDFLEYKKETIDKFVEILKRIGIDNADAITVIINQCKEYEGEDRTSRFSGENFKSVFTLLIYPILTAVASIIVSKMSNQDMVAWSIFIVGMIIIIYVMIALISPVISDFVNKYKNMTKMMRQDLEYIKVMLQNEVHQEEIQVNNIEVKRKIKDLKIQVKLK